MSGLIGALLAAMVLMNGELAAHLGNYESTTIVHLTGLFFVTVMVLRRRKRKLLHQRPALILYTGGALGFLTIVFANVGFVTLGVALTLSLGLFGQTVSALVIDHLGWFGVLKLRFDRRRIWSLTLILSGIAIMAYYK